MDPTTQAVLLGQLRTALASIGGALVMQGYVSSTTMNLALGIVMALVPLVWSAWVHIQAERATKSREAVALNVGIVLADKTAGPTAPVPPEQAAKIIEAVAPTLPVPPVESSTTKEIRP